MIKICTSKGVPRMTETYPFANACSSRFPFNRHKAAMRPMTRPKAMETMVMKRVYQAPLSKNGRFSKTSCNVDSLPWLRLLLRRFTEPFFENGFVSAVFLHGSQGFVDGLLQFRIAFAHGDTGVVRLHRLPDRFDLEAVFLHQRFD